MRKKRGNDFLNRNIVYNSFKNALNYIKESKNYILFMIFLFLISISAGYAFPKLFETQLLKMLKDLLQQTEGLGLFSMIRFIMVNNIKSSFFGMIFGIFYAIVPLAVIIVNGFLLGFVVNRVIYNEGIFVLWKLFPHGIFEIPAVIISVGIGLRLGLFLFSVKDRLRGALAFIFSICGFVFLFSLFSVILSFFSPNVKDLQSYFQSLMQNNIFVIFYVFLLILFFIISIYLSMLIFNKNEKEVIKKDFMYNLKMAILVFLFVVIPLLVIAGIIEGSLIIFMR